MPEFTILIELRSLKNGVLTTKTSKALHFSSEENKAVERFDFIWNSLPEGSKFLGQLKELSGYGIRIVKEVKNY